MRPISIALALAATACGAPFTVDAPRDVQADDGGDTVDAPSDVQAAPEASDAGDALDAPRDVQADAGDAQADANPSCGITPQPPATDDDCMFIPSPMCGSAVCADRPYGVTCYTGGLPRSISAGHLVAYAWQGNTVSACNDDNVFSSCVRTSSYDGACKAQQDSGKSIAYSCSPRGSAWLGGTTPLANVPNVVCDY